jgi:hypothetical protein
VSEGEIESTEDQATIEENKLEAPLEWYYPKDLRSRYATHMVVQRSEQEFYISFFEIPPPLIIGTPEEQQQQLNEMGAVKAECVARIIVAAGRMPEFVTVLQRNLERQTLRLQTPDAE